MARAEECTCQACYVRIRPQAFQEIRQGLRIHTCGNCKRLLFHPPSVEAFAGKAPTEPAANVTPVQSPETAPSAGASDSGAS